MRDPGLDEAIRAAGGVGALARKIGISQPSVSNWSRIPAERVLAVEAATGVDRASSAPRPLRRSAAPRSTSTRSMPRARRNTRCSPRCWRARPTANCSMRLATLRGDASPLGVAHARSRRPRAAPLPSASSANISISSSGSGAANCCPTAPIISPASCTSGRWRGCARISRARHRARRRQSEPEDHAAILCEIMAGDRRRTLRRAEGARPRSVRKASFALDRALLRRSGASRGGATSTALSARSDGLFMDIETEAFALPCVRRARAITKGGDTAMKRKHKTERWPS